MNIARLIQLGILIAAIVFGLILAKSFYGQNINNHSYSLPSDVQLSVWSWHDLTQGDILFAKREGVGTIYLTIDDYIDILELAESSEKKQKLENFENDLAKIIQLAKKEGISVHALAGNSKWANADYWYLPIQILNFVFRYNGSHPEAMLSGIQYDIEFYNSDEYETSQKQLSLEYLKLVAQLVSNAGSQVEGEFALGFTMPYWFDNENGNAPIVDWNGSKKAIGFHIIDILDLLPNSYVAVMAYRNYAEGEGGTIQIAKAEIDYAANSSDNVNVIIGQETENNEIEKITFFRKGREELVKSMRQIIEAFSNKSSFAGIAIHTLQGLKDLK